MNTTTAPTDHGQATPEQIALIVADQRAGEGNWSATPNSDADLLDYAWSTLALPSQGASMGLYELEESELPPALYLAYFAFLARAPEDVRAYRALLETRSTAPKPDLNDAGCAARTATDADGDKITAIRREDGTVHVVIATDGGDTYCGVILTAEQWATVISL